MGVNGTISPGNYVPAVSDAENVDEVKEALRGLVGMGEEGNAAAVEEVAKAIMGLRKRGLRGNPEVEALIKQAM